MMYSEDDFDKMWFYVDFIIYVGYYTEKSGMKNS